jgi:hypothetical protein
MNERQFHNLTLRLRAQALFRNAVLCFSGTVLCVVLSVSAGCNHSAEGCIGLAMLAVFCAIGGVVNVIDRRDTLAQMDEGKRLKLF